MYCPCVEVYTEILLSFCKYNPVVLTFFGVRPTHHPPAAGVMNDLDDVWRQCSLPVYTKFRLNSARVMTVLLYTVVRRGRSIFRHRHVFD